MGVHEDEVHMIGQLGLRLPPVKEIVGHRHRAAHRFPDLLDVIDCLVLGQLVIGPCNQNLVADIHRDDNLPVLVGQANRGRNLLRVLPLKARFTVQPKPQHHLDFQLVLLNHLQHIPGVLVAAIEKNQLPVLLQNREVFQNLRLSWKYFQLRALARAIAGVINGVAVPLLHGQIRIGLARMSGLRPSGKTKEQHAKQQRFRQ